jgi:hypothetical protein
MYRGEGDVKPASPALVALLNSSTGFIMADLYTFTLQGGATYLFSGAQTAITDTTTNRVFQLGPRFERSLTKTVIGIQSDELDVRIYPAPTDLLGSTLWAEAIWQGQLDGAELQLERAFMGASGGGYGDTSAGTVVLFAGRISDAEVSRTMISLKVRSHLELLNIEMPRRLWQPSCTFNFGDAMCGYNRVTGQNAAGTSTGNGQLSFDCAAGSTEVLILGVPETTTPYALGTIIALDGVNAGQSRTIASITPGVQVALKIGFLSPPNAGDGFQMLPGCDRSLATCGGVFQQSRVTPSGYNPDNPERFGGFPFVPPPENAI